MKMKNDILFHTACQISNRESPAVFLSSLWMRPQTCQIGTRLVLTLVEMVKWKAPLLRGFSSCRLALSSSEHVFLRFKLPNSIQTNYFNIRRKINKSKLTCQFFMNQSVIDSELMI